MAKKPIGEFLADLRRDKGYTQKQVADMLGISNRTLSAWEQGRAYPDILSLPALAEIYGVTADEILSGERRSNDGREIPAVGAEERAEQPHSSGDIAGAIAQEKAEDTLSRFSFRINVLTVVECVGAAVFAMGSVAAAAVLWLGCLLIVLGICAVITSVGLTCAFGNGAFASLCGKNFNKSEMSEEKRIYAVYLGKIISRFYIAGGAGWGVISLIYFVIFVPFVSNNLTVGLVFSLLPLALGAIFFAAGLISRIFVIKKYGNNAQRAIVKLNGKLFKKCCAFALIPIALACGVMAFFNFWRSEKVLFSGGEQEFISHMHTLIVDDSISEAPSGEYVLDFSGVTNQIYAPVGYGFEASLNVAVDCMYVAYRAEGNSKDYLVNSCTAFRLIVEGSDLAVYNVRYASNSAEYTNYRPTRYEARYVDGNYDLIESVSYAQEGYLAGILTIIASVAVALAVYLLRRKKLPE